jgi:uncharacterized protein (DUF488 family)
VKVYSIGFAGKSAEEFFGTLWREGIKKLVDVRLNNVSQLAGFTKSKDLKYFLRELGGADYRHELALAPTEELFKGFRQKKISWQELEASYLGMLRERQAEDNLDRAIVEGPSIFLCSEASPEHCHRRLALEYLQEKWGGFEIVHL